MFQVFDNGPADSCENGFPLPNEETEVIFNGMKITVGIWHTNAGYLFSCQSDGKYKDIPVKCEDLRFPANEQWCSKCLRLRE